MELQKYNENQGFELEFSIVESHEKDIRYGVRIIKRMLNMPDEVSQIENITESFNEILLLTHLLYAYEVTPMGLTDCLEHWYDYAASV